MTVVLADGCFDAFHRGHLEHLLEARAMGDKLIVALTVDEHVNKGPNRPVYPWGKRAEMLRELRCVDDVVPTANGAAAIFSVRPNLFVKGSDYTAATLNPDEVVACRQVGAEIRFTRAKKTTAAEVMKKLGILPYGE